MSMRRRKRSTTRTCRITRYRWMPGLKLRCREHATVRFLGPAPRFDQFWINFDAKPGTGQ